VTEFNLPANDFIVIDVLTTDTHTLLPKSDGILRNLNGTNKIVLVLEDTAGADAGTLVQDTLSSAHKLILQANEEALIKNEKRFVARANGGTCQLQWIPFRPVK